LRIWSNRNISYFFIGVTIIAITVLLYNTFYLYKEYQGIEKKIDKQIVFNRLSELLKEVEKEQFYSAVHWAKNNKYTSDKLYLQRLKTNEVMLKNKHLFSEESLKTFTQGLTEVRKKVNTFHLVYFKILSEGYQKSVIQPIIFNMEKIANSNCKINELMLIRLRNSINLENSFLAYSILSVHKMSSPDLVFWESILAKRILPSFITSKEREVFVKLHAILDLDTFPEIGSEERVQIFLDSNTGEYSLSLNHWLKIVNEKVKKIDEAENILVYNDKITLDNQLLRKEREVNKYIFIFLLLLILLALVLSMVHLLGNIHRDRRFLKETLREIEIDVDEKKKRELEALIQRNDSIEIYKFLANAIKEPSRAKDLFLANMSHEIRTPLNGIVGFTKELQETSLNDEQSEMLGIIEESSNHLIHIVNDILDFSKLKAGKVELESIPFNPIAKFEASIDTFVAKAREKNIELKVYIDPLIPTELLGDPTKILQILNNLISNAIKFTVNKGVVEIAILQLANNVRDVEINFLVKDSGIGVSEKEKEKIFDEFSQADVSTNRKYGGTGLGLSISSQFVKYMGGELKIESEVGRGSSFYFNLILEKTDNSKERERKNLHHFKVGYIPSANNRSVDAYLKTYIEYHGAIFNIYDRVEIFTLKEEKLPELLFIDYRCFDKKGELEYFFKLPLKIVLIVAENRESELRNIRHKIAHILHKPVNFTRTSKALDVLNSISTRDTLNRDEGLAAYYGKKALVAEDNFINQKLMKSILGRFGMEVTVVNNGEEAILSFEKEEYDIIFMDVQMPVMGGMEATKKILELETKNNTKHTPIIALTANALEGDKERFLKIGMDAYLAKPMKLGELEKVLFEFT